MTSAEHHSDGTSLLSHVRASPPSLKSIGESPSGQAALLRLSNCSSLVISATVEGLIFTSPLGSDYHYEIGWRIPASLIVLGSVQTTDEEDDVESGLKFRLSHKSLSLL